MWIERTISSELLVLAQQHPVVVLTGPRQVGKTSLLERLFPKHGNASLDVASNAEMAETRPGDFLVRYPPPLVVDEVQYAPAFFRDIKTAVDARRGQKGLFVLTGSQNFLLMERVSDSLAGRAAVVPFLGLSAEEWAAFRGPPSAEAWFDFLWRGSFPVLWSEGDASPGRDRWYQGYVATYLERDVRNLANVGSLRDFERMLRACAARCARTLNMSELARDVGVAPSTARQWISVLQASNPACVFRTAAGGTEHYVPVALCYNAARRGSRRDAEAQREERDAVDITSAPLCAFASLREMFFFPRLCTHPQSDRLLSGSIGQPSHGTPRGARRPIIQLLSGYRHDKGPSTVLQGPHRGQDVRGLRAPPIVDVGEGRPDDAFTIDQEDGRHREHVAPCPVVLGKVQRETLLV